MSAGDVLDRKNPHCPFLSCYEYVCTYSPVCRWVLVFHFISWVGKVKM